MMKQRYNILHIAFVTIVLLVSTINSRALFPDGSTGILQMPPVEMPASLFEISCHII